MIIDWRRHALPCLASIVVGLTQPACAQPPSGPAPYPSQEADWPGEGAVRLFDYMRQNRLSFWARRSVDKNSVVFFGDSLTGGWTSLQQDFPGLKVSNRAIGGDVTRGMLFRFQEDVVDLAPRALVMLAGSADLSALEPPEIAIRNIQRMLAILRQHDKTALVILCTVPPRDNPAAPVEPRQIDRLNAGLQALAAASPHVQLLDLHALMAKQGELDPSLFAADRLHLNSAGYRVWKQALTPLLVNAGLFSIATRSQPPSQP